MQSLGSNQSLSLAYIGAVGRDFAQCPVITVELTHEQLWHACQREPSDLDNWRWCEVAEKSRSLQLIKNEANTMLYSLVLFVMSQPCPSCSRLDLYHLRQPGGSLPGNVVAAKS